MLALEGEIAIQEVVSSIVWAFCRLTKELGDEHLQLCNSQHMLLIHADWFSFTCSYVIHSICSLFMQIDFHSSVIWISSNIVLYFCCSNSSKVSLHNVTDQMNHHTVGLTHSVPYTKYRWRGCDSLVFSFWRFFIKPTLEPASPIWALYTEYINWSYKSN